MPGFHCSSGTDEVSQALKNVDTDGTLSKEAEAGQLVERALERRIGDHRRAASGQNRDQITIARLVETVILQRPEQRDEFGRSGLQQRRHENVIGAETDAMAADGSARLLIQRT